MTTTGLVKYAGALAALAVCSACAAPAVAPSNAAPNEMPVTTALPDSIVRPIYPTLLPDRATKANTYEYIINDYGSYASIFDWPKSDQQVGTIHHGVGGQGCTNVLYGYGKKIMWIVAGPKQIEEFQVPKTPLKKLSVGSLGKPSSCAMNASGDLAVGILNYSGAGDVVIFKNASGSGTVYTTPLSREFFDGYDPQGDLFADGMSYSGYFAFVELPNGSSKFETITTSNTVQFPGSVQWDGKYITVFDQVTSDFYRYTISGTKATLQSTISITGASDCAQTWIVPGNVFCGDAHADNGKVYKYPAGGAPIAAFKGSFDNPLGATAAKK